MTETTGGIGHPGRSFLGRLANMGDPKKGGARDNTQYTCWTAPSFAAHHGMCISAERVRLRRRTPPLAGSHAHEIRLRPRLSARAALTYSARIGPVSASDSRVRARVPAGFLFTGVLQNEQGRGGRWRTKKSKEGGFLIVFTVPRHDRPPIVT